MTETETEEIDRENETLLRSLKADLPALEALLGEADSHWGFEDPFYRFYHQSWKVFGLGRGALFVQCPLSRIGRHRCLRQG